MIKMTVAADILPAFLLTVAIEDALLSETELAVSDEISEDTFVESAELILFEEVLAVCVLLLLLDFVVADAVVVLLEFFVVVLPLLLLFPVFSSSNGFSFE